MMIAIEKITKSALEKAKNLLVENDLPIEDIEASPITFFIATMNNNTVGTIGLEHYHEIGLLRSLAVKNNYKDLKIGSDLIEHLVKYCKKNSIKELYLLTTTAEKYFEKFNFQRIPRVDTPTVIKETKEFAMICPTTAVIMKKSLMS